MERPHILSKETLREGNQMIYPQKKSYIMPQMMWKCHLEQTSLLLILFQGILTREKNIYMYSYDLHSEYIHVFL